MILFLSLFFLCVKGQTTQVPNYSCNQNNDNVEFTLSDLSHSALQPTTNCFLQQCYLSSSNNNNCILSSTLCYDYRTLNNTRYCAPGIICSILEPCNNITYACTSDTSVCVINSCCSPQAVCLPLSVTNFCILGSTTTTTTSTETTSTSSTSTSTTKSTSSTTSVTTTTTRTTTTTSKTTSTTSKTSTSTTTSVTTPTTPTTATTTYSCSASMPASLATLSGSTNTSWVHYTYSYTANKMNPMLIFGVDASTSTYIALDDISVVDNANSSVQLLNNPSFENSSSTPTGWNIWCSSGCGAGSGGAVASSGCRSNRCYISECNSGGHDYLVQTFSATVGRNYTISFWSQRVRFGSSSTTVTLYVGII